MAFWAGQFLVQGCVLPCWRLCISSAYPLKANSISQILWPPKIHILRFWMAHERVLLSWLRITGPTGPCLIMVHVDLSGWVCVAPGIIVLSQPAFRHRARVYGVFCTGNEVFLGLPLRLILSNPRSSRCSLCLQTVNKCQYLLLTDVWVSAVLCWALAPSNHFSRRRIFFLLMAETAVGRGKTSPQSCCYREGLSKGWDLSSVGWLFQKPAWPTPPGHGSRPSGSAGLLLPSPCEPPLLCELSCIQEEPGPLGHNRHNFRNLGEEKSESGYLEFSSGPAIPPPHSQPAMPAKVV